MLPVETEDRTLAKTLYFYKAFQERLILPIVIKSLAHMREHRGGNARLPGQRAQHTKQVKVGKSRSGRALDGGEAAAQAPYR